MSPSRWLAIFAALAAAGGRRRRLWRQRQRAQRAAAAPANLSGEIAGAGSTAQEAAQEAWIAEFENANSGATVSYDAVGSGGGREQFIAGGVAFAGSDAALSEEEGELKKAIDRCNPGQLIEIPAYISPIAIIYNLEGVEALQLSAETLAGIFSQKITTWNDPAIAKENPGVELPDTRITPVNRSDESGTTENFTEYLSEVDPEGLALRSERRLAGQGRRGRVRAPPVSSKRSPPAKARSATPTRARPANSASPRSRSAATTSNRPRRPRRRSSRSRRKPRTSPRRPYMFPFELDRKTESQGTYPIVLVSYLIACTEYDSADEAALVKGYLEYVISPEGQEAAAENAGSAPLSSALTKKVEPAVAAIQG